MGDRVEEKIDSLANAVAQGFKEVDGRFDGMDGRFDRLESRVSVVEQKIDLVRADIQAMHFDHKKMITRIEKLELQTFGSVQE